MILEIERGAVVLLLFALVALEFTALFRKPASSAAAVTAPGARPAAPAPPVPPFEGPVREIVKRAGDMWLHVGYRHDGHPDLHEALRMPGLAVRHADGRIEGSNAAPLQREEGQ